MKRHSFIMFLLLFIGCVPPIVHNKKLFTLKDDSSRYNLLATNGYYYTIYDRKPNSGKQGKGIRMKVLLNNGYVNNIQNGYGNQCADSVSLTCEFEMSEVMLKKDLDWQKTKKYSGPTALWNWGRYRTENNKIIIQTFYNHFGDYYLSEEEGEMLDNNSFKIYRATDYKTGKTEAKEEIYFFKPFDVSPLYNKIPKHKVFK